MVAFARKRFFAREVIVIDCVLFKSSRVRPDCFALKWFRPGFRAISLPFLVTLIRLVYDLFVFIINVCNSMDCYYTFAFPATRSSVVLKPFGLFFISSAILYSVGIIFKNRSSRSLRKLSSMYL